MKHDRDIPVGRAVLLMALPLLFACSALFALYQLQVVKADYYAEESRNTIYSTETVVAARGDILDRYGRVLVTNRLSLDVTVDRQRLVGGGSPNETLLSLIALLDAFGCAHGDTLPISAEAPFAFLEDADMSAYLAHFELEGLSAAEQMQWFRTHYAIPEAFSDTEARLVAGVRWELECRTLFGGSAYVLAADLDNELIAAIAERSYPGVSIVTSTAREYRTKYAAHLLGRTGPIFQKELEHYTALGYPMDAIVGKDGIEQEMESELHGVDGSLVTVRSADGQIVDSYYQKEPLVGADVYLTLDLEGQQVLEDSLASQIAKINEERLVKAKEGETVQLAGAGAAVVLQVGSGEILASASYPSYDLSAFSQSYAALSADSSAPLLNRALQGLYAPGSTFKAVTAAAGLTDGVISSDTTIYDRGIIDEYEGYSYTCWAYPGSHGVINVKQALQMSCNYFFYKLGQMLGIDRLEHYATAFGLGQPTGVELYERTGTLATRTYKKEQLDESWYVGDTFQASIGQSFHLFTPLQLASYAATLAADGTRYRAHLLHSVCAANGNLLQRVEPEILSQVEADPQVFSDIKDGLLMASRYGSASYVFGNYDIPVCSKTGTAQVQEDTVNNAVFIAFAPRENPEIALSVVVEGGANGYFLAEVARDIFDWYFSQDEEPSPLPENALLP